MTEQLIAALAPFVAAYEKQHDEIADSDLYPEQPKHITVSLGDIRKAQMILRYAERSQKQMELAEVELRG